MCCLESGIIVQARPPSPIHLASEGNFLQYCPLSWEWRSQGCAFTSSEKVRECITSTGTVLPFLSQVVIQKPAVLIYRKQREGPGSGEREFTSLQQFLRKAIGNFSSPDNSGLFHTILSPEHSHATSLLFKESNEFVSVCSQELFCYILFEPLLHYG